jgi:16S rRNA processing protein RimM
MAQPKPRIAAARLAGTFGLHGELKCTPARGDESRLVAGNTYALLAEGDGATVTLSNVRRQHGRCVVALVGVATQEAAQRFVGSELFSEAETLPLAANEYLDVDLIGLRIVDEAGTALGTVGRIEHYPAQDCIVVRESGALIPLVQAFVRAIDVSAGTIVVSVPPGLLDPGSADEA